MEGLISTSSFYKNPYYSFRTKHSDAEEEVKETKSFTI